jgi:catechol 2,3-dioxygenase-like lactoylglutathione lyase family enzyme
MLLNDLHHMTFLTADLDRLIGFYERVFDARVTFDRTEEDPPRRRHALIEIGPHTVLHPFQVEGVQPPPRAPIFERGRLDHFALNASSEAAFREIRRRLMAEGAESTPGGLVTDMGSMSSFSFYDPDGGWHEVMWVKPGEPFNAGITRPGEWQLIDPELAVQESRVAVPYSSCRRSQCSTSPASWRPRGVRSSSP